jgi:hypothetical protein
MRLATALLTSLVLALGLAGCGGGGGGGDTSGTGDAPPSSGPYAWVLKAQGPTTSLTYGLSLVSPSKPGTEYLVEYGSSVLTDTRVVSTASVDVAGAKTGQLQPYALVYIVGGDVRRVPLQADGHVPSTLVKRAHSTTACRFLADADGQPIGDAIDYAQPENTRFVVSTAGPDGQCGTADDGTAEVRLSATDGLVFTESSGGTILGTFRDAGTLAPRGWIFSRGVVYWNASSGTSTSVRAAPAPAWQSVVQAAPTLALMDDGTQLSVVDFSSAGTTPTESLLDAATTGGGGWVGIGFDADAFYAYRNTGNGATAQWSVLKVTRNTPHATVLAGAGGHVGVASMGTGLLYVSTVSDGGNALVSVSKAIGAQAQTLESTPPSTLTTVQTSAVGVHELWRIVNIGTAALNYQVEFIDETGVRLYTTNAGGYPITEADAQVQRFDTSESRTRFVFASGYGSRAYGDAALMGYDATTKAAVTFGTLPGNAAFGTDTVYAGVVGGPTSTMAGYAASNPDGSIDANGSKVFTFDFAMANSLAYTTATR